MSRVIFQSKSFCLTFVFLLLQVPLPTQETPEAGSYQQLSATTGAFTDQLSPEEDDLDDDELSLLNLTSGLDVTSGLEDDLDLDLDDDFEDDEDEDDFDLDETCLSNSESDVAGAFGNSLEASLDESFSGL